MVVLSVYVKFVNNHECMFIDLFVLFHAGIQDFPTFIDFFRKLVIDSEVCSLKLLCFAFNQPYFCCVPV